MKKIGGIARLTSLYFAFFAIATISIVSGVFGPLLLIRLPTASRPRLNFFANASLTIATCGAVSAVGAREVAPGEQRDAERREIARADLVEARVRCRCRAPP